MKPPNVSNPLSPMSMGFWRVERLDVSYFVPKIVPFSLKFKVVVSLEKSQHPRSRMLYGPPMDPRLPFSVSTVLLLRIVSLNNSALSVTMFVSSLVAGMLHLKEEQVPIFLCTQLFIMSNTASPLETLALSVPSINLCTPCVSSRTNSFALTVRPEHASLKLIPPKHDSNLPLPTSGTDKSCIWYSTVASVGVPLWHTFNPRVSPKWLSTLFVNLVRSSVWPWRVVTLKLPWKVPSHSNNKLLPKARRVPMFGVNLAVRLCVKVITRLSR
mmetsp:Transcript_17985/g.27797  ORF Transcript_17985/g.27797 Transcript_17985/m.27797 type:complete len:270 (-) Transcript_17985:1727-2536(-)